jgi:hypothetical protein
MYMYYFLRKVDDTKGVIRIRKSKDRQYNDQNNQDKQRSTKYYTENFRSRNKNLTKNRGWTQVLEILYVKLDSLWCLLR